MHCPQLFQTDGNVLSLADQHPVIDPLTVLDGFKKVSVFISIENETASIGNAPSFSKGFSGKSDLLIEKLAGHLYAQCFGSRIEIDLWINVEFVGAKSRK